MGFEGFEDSDFVELDASVRIGATAPLRLRFWKMRSVTKLSILMSRPLWEELGAPNRFNVAWAEKKRALRLMAAVYGKFEVGESSRFTTVRLRVPLPAGIVASDGECAPEHYVDRERGQMLIEVPPGFGAPPPAPFDKRAAIEAARLAVPT